MRAGLGAAAGAGLSGVLLALGSLEAEDAPSAVLIVAVAALLGGAFVARQEIGAWLKRSSRTAVLLRLAAFTGAGAIRGARMRVLRS